MSTWFRFHNTAMRNPKVAKLTDSQFRLWVELLSVASENDGIIPSADDLKHVLKRRLDHLLRGLDDLIRALLIDPLEHGYKPHGWEKNQYKSDTSTERVRAHREKRNVSETPPEQIQIQIQKERKKESRENPDFCDGKITPIEAPPAKPNDGYAFEGKTIKLNQSDFDQWRKTYHTIGDLRAELSGLDAWYGGQDAVKRKGWFNAVPGMLSKKHQEILEKRHLAGGAVIPLVYRSRISNHAA